MGENILLKIIQTWNLSLWPEYRGFRCANCQKYMNKAWYHWLDNGGYRTPVHFCKNCERDFRTAKIEVKKPQIKVDRAKFDPKLPRRIRTRIGKIADRWNTAARPIYKMFVCDECDRKMTKAWHVWANLKGLLVETHFCKECGKRLELDKIIRGVIYDLDGTLIVTVELHRMAWFAAGRKFGVKISEEMMKNQNGLADEEAALTMLPKEKKSLMGKFVLAKQEYVRANAKKARLFPETAETISKLFQKGYRVWVLTSAHKFFVKKVLNISKPLERAIGNNVVWREMYKRGKPKPDGLNLTMKNMGLVNSQVCYVGDAFSDYRTSVTAKVKFFYFCPDQKKRDKRISLSIPVISSHEKIFKKIA